MVERFTLQIQTKDGTVLFRHEQQATSKTVEKTTGTNTWTETDVTQTYPHADNYFVGYEHMVDTDITDLLELLHEALDSYQGRYIR